MDRLISSWQQVGDYVDSYTYYSYDDKGRAYRSDFCLMGTAGGALAQTYEYAYDADDGSLAGINVSYTGATPVSNTISYNYDSLKRLSTKTYGTDSFQIAQNYTYVDLPGTRTGTQVTGYSVNINNTTAKNYSYTYDNLGNILTISLDDTVIYEYMYDAQGQLIDEILWLENYGIEYIYDDYGNIQTATKYDIYSGEPLEDVTQDVYVYGDENGWHDRLTSFNGGSITYDTIGNPIDYYNGKEYYYFVWQNGRELASASYGHSTVYYKYGADGLRVQKNVDGAVHDYYYSDGLLVREVITYGYGYVEILDFLYDESGTPYSFIYGFVNSGNVYTTQYYYVKNLQNDVIAIVDEYGNMAAEYTYDAWGCVLYTNEYTHDNIGYVNPIRYRSYYQDTETGFYYLQTRYYDPAIRRFINADGYINANGDFIGFNMYAYCGNNPVNCVDYAGELVITIFGITLGAKAIVSISVAAIASVAILSVAVPFPSTGTGDRNKPFDNLNNPLDNLKQNDTMFKVVIGSLAVSLISSMHKAENKNVNGTAEHHIVPKQAFLCQGAISKMERLGIDRNDPINIMTVSTRLHYYLHTQTYYFNVALLIESAYLAGRTPEEQKANVISAINRIRTRIDIIDKWIQQ